jgi:predicted aminopeptidase
MTAWRWLWLAGVPLLIVQLAGCNPLYLLQATAGQMELLRLRRPVADVIADPSTAVAVREALQGSAAILEFAHTTLLLPDNGAYRHYADLRRPFAVWNVFAAPEFSLELRRWCFPVAGCVGYRGYFEESAARDYAARLARGGVDTYVAGVAAYSTLGYFADPLLNTVITLPSVQLAGLLFHELAHQLIYVPDDTAFNESFARFVEQEGLRRWFDARGDAEGACAMAVAWRRQAELRRLLGASRQRLAEIFASEHPAEEKRAAKVAELGRLMQAYNALRTSWQNPPYFDSWFTGPLNNATLGALAAYDEYVPAFRELLRSQSNFLLAFYAQVRDLAKLSEAERAAALAELRARAEAGEPATAEHGCFAPSGSANLQ